MKGTPILAIVVVAVVILVAGCPAPPVAPSVLPTGTTPNAVAVVRCEGGPRLLVTASAEGRLDVLDPAGAAPPTSIFLGVGTSPWDVAVARHGADVDVTDRGSRAVVTLSGSHGIALVRPCGDADDGDVLHIATDPEAFDLASPVTLRQAEDVDGDGVAEDVAGRMIPRTPQAVAVADDGRVVVAFANLLAFATGVDEPMLAGPGTVSTWTIVDDTLVRGARSILPCDNPGGVAADGSDVHVACAGRYGVSADGHDKASAGAIVTLDGQGLVVAVSSSAQTPGPILVHDGAVVTGDLLDGSLHRLERGSLAPLAVLAGAADATDGVIDSAFALTVDADAALLAGWFDGRIVRDPFGADSAVVAEAPSGPPRGLVDLVHDGERLWGLHTLAAELVVMGAAP